MMTPGRAPWERVGQQRTSWPVMEQRRRQDFHPISPWLICVAQDDHTDATP